MTHIPPGLQGHINRKLVKQTVMTSVYGVTYIGARQQIQNRLLERGWSHNEQLYRCANYAARVRTYFFGLINPLVDVYISRNSPRG